jgi:hypothetical protein
MPVSGGDIGLNAWVENDQILLYLGRAGYRDENGALLKAGRVRLSLSPNPFAGATFRQELTLRDGSVEISGTRQGGESTRVKIWVEVHRPVVHVDVTASSPVSVEAAYESWRAEDIELPNDPRPFSHRAMCQLNYGKYPGKVYLYRDIIRTRPGQVRFHHRVDNRRDCFAFQVKQQELTAVRDKLKNPLSDLTWGGALVGDRFEFTGKSQGEYAGCPYTRWTYRSLEAAPSHRLRVCLHVDQCADLGDWDSALDALVESPADADADAWQRNCGWWTGFWNRSHLVINSGRGEADSGWRVGRNYQLFRYMLACNVQGREPTLFNGGLFTFDPLFVNGRQGPGYTPDHRQWGAGLTAQNQRMLVWPLLKTGDFDLVVPGVSHYIDGLQNAMARVRHYWNHEGCCFTEQTTITALPGSAVYGFREGGERERPPDLEPGVQMHPAVCDIYESQLEYAWLMLRWHAFSGVDLRPLLPFIEQSVIFYDEHYRFRHRQLTGHELDPDGKLVIAPSNTLESHPQARNPTSVTAGLKRLLGELLALPASLPSSENAARWARMVSTLPDMATADNPLFGGPYLKPAENYEHTSWHCPEMYPLYPYELFGIGLPNLELMKHTSLATGEDRLKTAAWLQGNIHAARLGDTALAKDLEIRKMDNGPYRFPAFWPHDIDWAPDHNWGGCGMIGLQEMLMQTHALPGEADLIRLFPAWPEDWDVDFKLHAPHQTTVEGSLRTGQGVVIKVTPEDRRKDVIDMRGPS